MAEASGSHDEDAAWDEERSATLAKAEITLAGRLPWSSNLTLMGLLHDAAHPLGDAADLAEHANYEPLGSSRFEGMGADELLALAPLGACVYKPAAQERPLWDFEEGSLCRREVAAWEVSESLGWSLVPPTVLRQGPLGVGSVQHFVDADYDEHFLTLVERGESERARFRQFALFDALINNTDRKSGHCLLARGGAIVAIDHGVSFHTEPKLRTVIWDFAGEEIEDHLVSDVARLAVELDEAGPIASALGSLLSADEIAALSRRAKAIVDRPVFPDPASRHSLPWPMI